MLAKKPGHIAKEFGIARRLLHLWEEVIEDFGPEALPGHVARRDLNLVVHSKAAPERARLATS